MSTPSTRSCSSEAESAAFASSSAFCAISTWLFGIAPLSLSILARSSCTWARRSSLTAFRYVPKAPDTSVLCTSIRSWPFLTIVADAGVDFDDTARGDGDNWNGAGDVGIDRAGDLDRRSRRITGRSHQRELFRGGPREPGSRRCRPGRPRPGELHFFGSDGLPLQPANR